MSINWLEEGVIGVVVRDVIGGLTKVVSVKLWATDPEMMHTRVIDRICKSFFMRFSFFNVQGITTIMATPFALTCLFSRNTAKVVTSP